MVLYVAAKLLDHWDTLFSSHIYCFSCLWWFLTASFLFQSFESHMADICHRLLKGLEALEMVFLSFFCPYSFFSDGNTRMLGRLPQLFCPNFSSIQLKAEIPGFHSRPMLSSIFIWDFVLGKRATCLSREVSELFCVTDPLWLPSANAFIKTGWQMQTSFQGRGFCSLIYCSSRHMVIKIWKMYSSIMFLFFYSFIHPLMQQILL